MVVHGMHALLWALEILAADGRLRAEIQGIRFEFRHFIMAGDSVALYEVGEHRGAVRYELHSEGLAATFDVAFGTPGPPAAPLSERVLIIPQLADSGLSAETARGGGILPGLGAEMFPHLGVNIGACRVGAMARISTVVGMFAPGRNAIFSEGRLSFCSPQEQGLSFAVQRADERLVCSKSASPVAVSWDRCKPTMHLVR